MADSFLSTIVQRFQEFSIWGAQKFEGSSSLASASPLPSTLLDDLAALQRTLERIEAVLCDAQEREICDKSVHLWLRELRGVAYDADDVLDEYEYELLRAKAAATDPDLEFPLNPPGERRKAEQVGASTTTSPLTMDVLFWDRIASRIRRIRVRFEEISREREALHLRDDDGRRLRQSGGRPPTSSVIAVSEVDIQGRESDLDKLIHGLLLSDECRGSNLTVIPVVGMPGVGKTTLVQHVYNNPAICDHFELWGWVCVSIDFDVIKLTRKIIESFSNSTPCDLTELDALQQRLKELLKDKRFLLVLDDVWNDDRGLWDRLHAPLSYGGKGSAVITTTRSAKTARTMQTVPFHSLECLSNVHCWAIFQRFAFCGLDPSDYKEMVETGKKIVQKCKGLPLAAKALGSMLRYESEIESWKDVLQSEIWELGDRDGEILPALMLSYVHLPPHLKRCFVYCSLFPKDFRFRKDELVLLWMAQGFIQCNRRKQVVDRGAAYVDELMQRSFFQYYESENATIFVMHDLIHDLAQYNSKGEFCRIETNISLDPSHTRHLSIASMSHDITTVLESLPAAGGLRTLHLFSVNETKGLPSILMKNLKGLRTLILSDQQIVELPDSIGDLKHLRYLDLSGTDVAKLPETVSNLYFLQTLLLRRCKDLESLPEVILKLSNLRCLEFSRYL